MTLGCIAIHRLQTDGASQSDRIRIPDHERFTKETTPRTTYDLELGAVVFALKNWRHYLYRTKYTVYIDHRKLATHLWTKDLNTRQHRWLELLNDYNCAIKYHRARLNVVADALAVRIHPRPVECEHYKLTEHNLFGKP